MNSMSFVLQCAQVGEIRQSKYRAAPTKVFLAQMLHLAFNKEKA
jgi:hypothetical protein